MGFSHWLRIYYLLGMIRLCHCLGTFHRPCYLACLHLYTASNVSCHVRSFEDHSAFICLVKLIRMSNQMSHSDVECPQKRLICIIVHLFAQLCGLKDPLTEIEPEMMHGRIVAMAISISALGIISVSFRTCVHAYSGITTLITSLEPAYVFADSQFAHCRFLFKVVVGLAGAMAVNGDLIFMFEAGVTRCCRCCGMCASSNAAPSIKKNFQPEEEQLAQGLDATPSNYPAHGELTSSKVDRAPRGSSLDGPATNEPIEKGV